MLTLEQVKEISRRLALENDSEYGDLPLSSEEQEITIWEE